MFKFVKNNPLASFLFLLAFIVGVYTRIVMPQLAYTEFQGDQSNESFVHSKILDQGLVPYGPASSIGKYFLPGGYYTLQFLFSFGSSNPHLHLLSNSIFSLLTIPLFGFLIYRAFNSFKNSFLVASFASLLWSIFACDIFFAGFQWNPNSVTFFWMLLTVNFELLYSKVLLGKIANLAWTMQGLILGILISLHSSSMFIIPLIFAVNTFYISFKQKSHKWIWGILGFVLIMLPYLLAEIQSNFQNTVNIFDTVFTQAKVSHTLAEKLNHFLEPVEALANQVYFSQTNMPLLSFALVLITIVLCFIFYNGRQFYLANYILLLGLFLLASNNYWGGLYRHFMVLVWSVPLFCAVSLIFSISQIQFKKYISIGLLVLGFSFFTQQSLEGIHNIYQNKFGINRAVNIADMNLALSKVPDNQTICSNGYGNSLKYLNYINKGIIKTQTNCKILDLEFVENYKTNDFNRTYKNDYDLKNKNIFYKSDAFTIVKLK